MLGGLIASYAYEPNANLASRINLKQFMPASHCFFDSIKCETNYNLANLLH